MTVQWNSTEPKPHITDFGYEVHSQPYDVVALCARDAKGRALFVTYLSKDDVEHLLNTLEDNDCEQP